MTHPSLSFPATTLVRTGAERATLVRRTYALVLASVVVTMIGVAFGLTQPALMQTVARHPFISFLFVLAPLFMAMQMRQSFPANIGLTLLFTFAEGLWLSPVMLAYSRLQPGVVPQAGILTLGTFGVPTGYAFATRRDLSALRSFLTG